MSTLRSRLRGDAPTALVAAVVVVALVAALIRYPPAVRALNNRAAYNARLSDVDRDLELAERVGIDRDFVLAAMREIPERDRYAVATGAAAPQPTRLALPALRGYLQNLLLPRFQTEEDPRWLLCYGCDVSTADGRFRRVWHRGTLQIGRLER